MRSNSDVAVPTTENVLFDRVHVVSKDLNPSPKF